MNNEEKARKLANYLLVEYDPAKIAHITSYFFRAHEAVWIVVSRDDDSMVWNAMQSHAGRKAEMLDENVQACLLGQWPTWRTLGT